MTFKELKEMASRLGITPEELDNIDIYKFAEMTSDSVIEQAVKDHEAEFKGQPNP